MNKKNQMDVTHEYAKHHYVYRWDHEKKVFCPACGANAVWRDYLSGDMESAPDHMCAACDHHFGYEERYRDDLTASIAEQLRTGVQKKPTTPSGHPL